jgi:hypothetical protein
MAAAGCTARKTVTTGGKLPGGLTAIQERQAMPAFSLADLNGNTVHSGDFLGNVLLLRFWATW